MRMEPFEQSRHLDEDCGLFEAAAHAQGELPPPPAITTVYLALDGSNQDDTARRFSAALMEQHHATLVEIKEADDALAIVSRIDQTPGSLLILPVPFGQDYERLAGESLGSVVDMVLLESRCPVLCIRGVMDKLAVHAALMHIVAPVVVKQASVEHSLSWAITLAATGAKLDLFATADVDVLEEVRHWISGDTPHPPGVLAHEQVLRGLTREMGGLVAASQRMGRSRGLHVHVETHIGPFVKLVLQHSHDRNLIVWGAERDHRALSFHRATDLILGAKGPVFIV